MLQIGERTNFIIALCSNLQIFDSCPLLEPGTVLKFFIRAINESAGRVVFFRNNRFSLTLHFDAFPDTFLCVFLTKQFRTATDKMFFIQRTERDVFGSIFFKIFVCGSWLDTKIDVPSKLGFPSRAILIRLPFFVFFTTFTTRNNDGKVMRFEKTTTRKIKRF